VKIGAAGDESRHCFGHGLKHIAARFARGDLGVGGELRDAGEKIGGNFAFTAASNSLASVGLAAPQAA